MSITEPAAQQPPCRGHLFATGLAGRKASARFGILAREIRCAAPSDKRQARGGARLERTIITPLERDSKMSASRVTGLGQRSGGIEIGLILFTKLRCKQHDMQQVSRLVPGGAFESFPVLASMQDALGTGWLPP